MMPRTSRFSKIFLFGALALTGGPGVAQAGFQWVPPSEISNPPVQAAPVITPESPMPVVPVPSVAPAPADRVLSNISRNDPSLKSANPVADPYPQSSVAAGQGMLRSADMMVHPMVSRDFGMDGSLTPPPSPAMASLSPLPVAPVSAASNDSYPHAIGFGRDLPMAMAISQIVPPEYPYSFGTEVDPGTIVSWEGGAPWPQVLNDALRPAGLSAAVADGRVTVQKGTAAAVQNLPPVQAAAFGGASSLPTSLDLAQAMISEDIFNTVAAPAPMAAMPVPAYVQPAVAQTGGGMSIHRLLSAPAAGFQTAQFSAPGAMAKDTVRVWQAERGSSLRTVLGEWSTQAGVELHWSSEFDFPLESAVRFNGTFEDAVQTLLTGLRDAQPRPIGRLHPNLPDGPSVLVIETKHVIQ